MWETLCFISYHQKFYCPFQQVQAANSKVSLCQQSYRTRCLVRFLDWGLLFVSNLRFFFWLWKLRQLGSLLTCVVYSNERAWSRERILSSRRTVFTLSPLQYIYIYIYIYQTLPGESLRSTRNSESRMLFGDFTIISSKIICKSGLNKK